MPTRRALLAAGGSAALAGCGFHPMYLPQNNGRASVASEELAAVYVPIIPERAGQLLRQALQARIEGAGTGIAKKFELVATLSVSVEGIAIQRDSSVTRYRFDGRGNWTLRMLDLAHTVLGAGTSRVLDGVNISNQQYFAYDLESQSAFKRVAEGLADQIVQQAGVLLKRRAEAAPAAT